MKIVFFVCFFGMHYELSQAIECPICNHTAHKTYNIPQDIVSGLGYNNNRTDFKCATNTKTTAEHCGPKMVSCSSRYYLYEGLGNQTLNGANVISEVVLRDCSSETPAQECLKIPDPKGAKGFTSFTGLSCFSASPRVFNLTIHEYDVNETARHMYSTGTVALPSYFAWMYCPIPLLNLLMILSI